MILLNKVLQEMRDFFYYTGWIIYSFYSTDSCSLSSCEMTVIIQKKKKTAIACDNTQLKSMYHDKRSACFAARSEWSRA